MYSQYIIAEKVNNGKLLGKGAYGSVYLIKTDIFEGIEKNYVVKVSDIFKGNEDPCITTGNEKNLVCMDSLKREYEIANYLSKDFVNGECINFTKVLKYDKIGDKEILVMDQVVGGEHLNLDSETNLGNSYKLPLSYYRTELANLYLNTGFPESDEFAEFAEFADMIDIGCYIQTMYAIAFYQEKYKISHHDLKLDNILVEYVTKDTIFNDKKVIEYDWFHYSIGGKSIYLPAMPVIIKIIDFGIGCKYENPKVLIDGIEEITLDTDNGIEEYFPSRFTPSYDAVYFTIKSVLNVGWSRCFIMECLRYLTGINEKNIIDILRQTLFDVFDPLSDKHPDPNKLKTLKTKTAKELLHSKKIQSTFGKKPESGKIITLGSV